MFPQPYNNRIDFPEKKKKHEQIETEIELDSICFHLYVSL